jgi:hypothetical protein
MNPCKKRVLRVFGALLVLAVLFVPYRAIHLSYKRDISTNLIWRTTAKQSGYMFLPRFLKARSIKVLAKDQDRSIYLFNVKMLAAEIGIILFLGTLDYFLLCALLKRTKKIDP